MGSASASIAVAQSKGFRRYPRNVGDEQIFVAAHFRLAPHISHAANCKYSVEKTINRFVAHSKAVRDFDKDAKPILERVAGKQAAEFRLHILMEALHKAKYHAQRGSGKASQFRSINSPTGAEYIQMDKVLKSYFRSAKGILALAARLQGNPDLEAWVTLKYGDQIITWDKFFFDLDAYQELYEYLEAERQKPKTSIYPRPIAAVLKVYQNTKVTPANGEYRLLGTHQVITTKAKSKLAIRPILYFGDEDLAETKSNEPYLLVCGIPRLGNVRPPSNPKLNDAIDIWISVVDARQVCQYSPT